VAHIKNIFTDTSNIVNSIKKEIEKAKHYIYICVSWINVDIFKGEINSAIDKGLEVHIITDSSNNANFDKLHSNVKVTKLGFELDEKQRFYLHNKFAIVDGVTLILGSYNWSLLGKKHFENLSIISLDEDDINDSVNYTIDEYERQFLKLSKMNNNILKSQYLCETSKTLVINMEEETAYIIDYEHLEQYYTTAEEIHLDNRKYISFTKYFSTVYTENEEKRIILNNKVHKDLFAIYLWKDYIIVEPKGGGGKGFEKLYSNIFQDFKAPDHLMLPPY